MILQTTPCTSISMRDCQKQLFLYTEVVQHLLFYLMENYSNCRPLFFFIKRTKCIFCCKLNALCTLLNMSRKETCNCHRRYNFLTCITVRFKNIDPSICNLILMGGIFCYRESNARIKTFEMDRRYTFQNFI